jgi:hypothetical protein
MRPLSALSAQRRVSVSISGPSSINGSLTVLELSYGSSGRLRSPRTARAISTSTPIGTIARDTRLARQCVYGNAAEPVEAKTTLTDGPLLPLGLQMAPKG